MAEIPDSRALGDRSVPQARSRIAPRDRSGEIIGEAVAGLGEMHMRLDAADFETSKVLYEANVAEIMQKYRQQEVKTDDALTQDLKPVKMADGSTKKLTRKEQFEKDLYHAKVNAGFKVVHYQGRYGALLNAAERIVRVRGLAMIDAIEAQERQEQTLAGHVQAEDKIGAVIADPDSKADKAQLIAGGVRMYQESAAQGVISQAEAQERIRAWGRRGAALALESKSPAERLQALETPDAGIAKYLSPEQQITLRARAEADLADEIESTEAERIGQLWRQDARAGAAALASLDESDLPPERQDGIRRKVNDSVSLLRAERQAEYTDAMARLETSIAIGADYAEAEGAIETLYRRGALTPAQYGSLKERSAVSAQRSAERQASQREILATLEAGLPLDPANSKHRDFLGEAFAMDAGSRKPDSPEWQALALGYASQVRLLPPQASSWLRSAARSPSVDVATTAASFYGSLEQQSPEAAGSLDPDTKAFLGQMGGMIDAGASPKTAFETARANTFETRPDVLKAREEAYKPHARQTDAALASYIDRDFDTAFRAQPLASQTLRADFEAQTRRYFLKTGGDIELARDLAWRDVRRVYGETEVNGVRVVSAFPVEQFGVSAAEARADVADAVRGTGIRPEDVAIVPDALTLRSVTDSLSGQAVMPSWRLVTPEGDLVVDADGVPLRYSLPAGEELTKRIEAKRAKARADADAAIEEAKRRRELLRRTEAQRARIGPEFE